MTTFSIALDARDPAASIQLATVLASVPARFRATDRVDADVVVVSGAALEWLDRVGEALLRRPRAVLLVRPGLTDFDRLRDVRHAAASKGTLVAVDVGYAADRAWRRALPRIRQDVTSAVLLDSVVTSAEGGAPALFTALLAQLALIRSLVGSLERIQVVHQTDRQYAVTAQAPSLPMYLTGAASSRGANMLRVDLVGAQRRWRVRLNADALARPGEIVRFDADGAHAEPPRYESPHRAVLLDLQAALTDGSPLAYTLDDLADDMALASQLELGARTSVA